MTRHGQEAAGGDAPEELDLLALVKKIEQRMVYLEKKIDILIAQSGQPSKRPFEGKRFSKPYRHGGHFNRQQGPGGAGGHSQGRGYSQDRPFYKPFTGRHREQGQGGFGPRKKSSFHRRKDRE